MKNTLHDRKVFKKEVEEKLKKLEMEHFWDYTKLLLDTNAEVKEEQTDFIARQLMIKLDLDARKFK